MTQPFGEAMTFAGRAMELLRGYRPMPGTRDIRLAKARRELQCAIDAIDRELELRQSEQLQSNEGKEESAK